MHTITEVRWRTLAMVFIGYTVLLRLIYVGQIELLPEETYYWNYSRHLDIGYLDHPPMVAWLIRIGTAVFGDTEFGVRFGSLCCGLITSSYLYRLTRNVFGEPSALAALILAQVLPFFFFSGMLMTPDAPLTAAWAALLYYLERALIARRSGAWIGAGLCLGFGLLSKYTIGLVGVSTLMFMVIDPHSRPWFKRWEPSGSAAIAAVVFAPVVVWNCQHEWVSFAFQTSRRLSEPFRFSLHKLIGAAIILITPTGLTAVGVGFLGSKALQSGTNAASADRVQAQRQWRLLGLALFLPLSIFVMFSLTHEIKLDWTGAPWVAAIPVLAAAMAKSPGVGDAHAWLRTWWPPTLIVTLFIYCVGFVYLAMGLPGVGFPSQMELVPVGWRELGRQIDEIGHDARARYGERLLVIGMDRYAIASELAFYSRDRVQSVADTSTAHLFEEMGLMYELWFPAQRQVGRTLLLVAWDRNTLSASHVLKHVAALDAIDEGVLMRDGKIIRHYYYRVAHGYRAAKPTVP